MLPEGWVDGRVGDLLNGLESGVSVNGEDRLLNIGEFGVLKVSSVTYGTFNPKAVKAIIPQDLPRAKCHPRAGQIIISRSNTDTLVGASAFIEKDHPNLFLSDKLWQTSPKPGSCMKWLSYMLASDHSRYLLSNLATGTSGSMKNITKSELLTLKVLVPPLPEQKKIAQILSTWDNAISATERLLENSQQRKKALMQQLLTGKKRLPGFKGEWKNGSLKDIASISKGKALSSKDLIEGDYPVIAGGKTSPYNHKDFTHENVVTVSASGAYAGYVALHPYKFWASDCSVVEAKKFSDMNFIYYFMVWKQSRIYSLQSGGAQPHIYPKDLHVLHIDIPDKDEQQAIANVLTTADQEIDALQKRLDHLKQEKKALMQQLLTGKRRVTLN